MTQSGRRWMEVVDEWELGGRKSGDVPPGMGEPKPESDWEKRDYNTPYSNYYFLRPEVRTKRFFFFLLFSFSFFRFFLKLLISFFDRLLRVFSSCGGLREM